MIPPATICSLCMKLQPLIVLALLYTLNNRYVCKTAAQMIQTVLAELQAQSKIILAADYGGILGFPSSEHWLWNQYNK